MHGRSNRRRKVVFSNFSVVLWALTYNAFVARFKSPELIFEERFKEINLFLCISSPKFKKILLLLLAELLTLLPAFSGRVMPLLSLNHSIIVKSYCHNLRKYINRYLPCFPKPQPVIAACVWKRYL